jgi:transporter family protein
MPWWLLALLGAFFGGLVSVLVKPGLGSEAAGTKITSNLGTAIRMLAVFPLAWAVVAAEGSWNQLHKISTRQWAFLLVSGAATGLSWLFYFAAISKGEVNRVNPIDKTSLAFSFFLAAVFLGEGVKWQTLVASLLVIAALFVTMIPSTSKPAAPVPPTQVDSAPPPPTHPTP